MSSVRGGRALVAVVLAVGALSVLLLWSSPPQSSWLRGMNNRTTHNNSVVQPQACETQRAPAVLIIGSSGLAVQLGTCGRASQFAQALLRCDTTAWHSAWIAAEQDSCGRVAGNWEIRSLVAAEACGVAVRGRTVRGGTRLGNVHDLPCSVVWLDQHCDATAVFRVLPHYHFARVVVLDDSYEEADLPCAFQTIDVRGGDRDQPQLLTLGCSQSVLRNQACTQLILLSSSRAISDRKHVSIALEEACLAGHLASGQRVAVLRFATPYGMWQVPSMPLFSGLVTEAVTSNSQRQVMLCGEFSFDQDIVDAFSDVAASMDTWVDLAIPGEPAFGGWQEGARLATVDPLEGRKSTSALTGICSAVQLASTLRLSQVQVPSQCATIPGRAQPSAPSSPEASSAATTGESQVHASNASTITGVQDRNSSAPSGSPIPSPVGGADGATRAPSTYAKLVKALRAVVGHEDPGLASFRDHQPLIESFRPGIDLLLAVDQSHSPQLHAALQHWVGSDQPADTRLVLMSSHSLSEQLPDHCGASAHAAVVATGQGLTEWAQLHHGHHPSVITDLLHVLTECAARIFVVIGRAPCGQLCGDMALSLLDHDWTELVASHEMLLFIRQSSTVAVSPRAASLDGRRSETKLPVAAAPVLPAGAVASVLSNPLLIGSAWVAFGRGTLEGSSGVAYLLCAAGQAAALCGLEFSCNVTSVVAWPLRVSSTDIVLHEVHMAGLTTGLDGTALVRVRSPLQAGADMTVAVPSPPRARQPRRLVVGWCVVTRQSQAHACQYMHAWLAAHLSRGIAHVELFFVGTRPVSCLRRLHDASRVSLHVLQAGDDLAAAQAAAGAYVVAKHRHAATYLVWLSMDMELWIGGQHSDADHSDAGSLPRVLTRATSCATMLRTANIRIAEQARGVVGAWDAPNLDWPSVAYQGIVASFSPWFFLEAGRLNSAAEAQPPLHFAALSPFAAVMQPFNMSAAGDQASPPRVQQDASAALAPAVQCERKQQQENRTLSPRSAAATAAVVVVGPESFVGFHIALAVQRSGRQPLGLMLEVATEEMEQARVAVLSAKGIRLVQSSCESAVAALEPLAEAVSLVVVLQPGNSALLTCALSLLSSAGAQSWVVTLVLEPAAGDDPAEFEAYRAAVSQVRAAASGMQGVRAALFVVPAVYGEWLGPARFAHTLQTRATAVASPISVVLAPLIVHIVDGAPAPPETLLADAGTEDTMELCMVWKWHEQYCRVTGARTCASLPMLRCTESELDSRSAELLRLVQAEPQQPEWSPLDCEGQTVVAWDAGRRDFPASSAPKVQRLHHSDFPDPGVRMPAEQYSICGHPSPRFQPQPIFDGAYLVTLLDVAVVTLHRRPALAFLVACEARDTVADLWGNAMPLCAFGDAILRLHDDNGSVIVEAVSDSWMIRYSHHYVSFPLPDGQMPHIMQATLRMNSSHAHAQPHVFTTTLCRDPPRRKHNVTLCTIPMYLPSGRLSASRIAELHEWLDYNYAIGVDHVVLYDRSDGFQFRAAVQQYIDAGVLTFEAFPLWSAALYCAAAGIGAATTRNAITQIAAQDHCLFRHRHRSAWMLYVDPDEYVNTDRGAWPSMLQELVQFPGNVWVASVILRNLPCGRIGGDQAGDVTPFQQLTHCASHPFIKSRQKPLARSDLVSAMRIHGTELHVGERILAAWHQLRADHIKLGSSSYYEADYSAYLDMSVPTSTWEPMRRHLRSLRQLQTGVGIAAISRFARFNFSVLSDLQAGNASTLLLCSLRSLCEHVGSQLASGQGENDQSVLLVWRGDRPQGSVPAATPSGRLQLAHLDWCELPVIHGLLSMRFRSVVVAPEWSDADTGSVECVQHLMTALTAHSRPTGVTFVTDDGFRPSTQAGAVQDVQHRVMLACPRTACESIAVLRVPATVGGWGSAGSIACAMSNHLRHPVLDHSDARTPCVSAATAAHAVVSALRSEPTATPAQIVQVVQPQAACSVSELLAMRANAQDAGSSGTTATMLSVGPLAAAVQEALLWIHEYPDACSQTVPHTHSPL